MALTALGRRAAARAHHARRRAHAGRAPRRHRVALLALAPVVAHQLDVATDARASGASHSCSTRRSRPQQKLELAPSLLAGVDAQDPRDGLRRAVAGERHRFAGAELAAYDRLGERADETLIAAVADAFHVAFLVTGGARPARGARRRALARAAARGTGPRGGGGRRGRLPAAYAVLHRRSRPPRCGSSTRAMPNGSCRGRAASAGSSRTRRCACSTRRRAATARARGARARAHRRRRGQALRGGARRRPAHAVGLLRALLR